jgi:transcriptional regulator with GAF, ATPase, and Fis domain
MITEIVIASTPWSSVTPDPFLFVLTSGLIGLAAPLAKTSSSKVREIEIVKSITSWINQSLDLPEILESSLDRILRFFGMEAGAVRLVETSDAPPPIAIHRGFDRGVLSALAKVESTLLKELAKKQSLTIKDLRRDGIYSELAESLSHAGWDAFELFPIQTEDRLWGTLGNFVLVMLQGKVLDNVAAGFDRHSGADVGRGDRQ